MGQNLIGQGHQLERPRAQSFARQSRVNGDVLRFGGPRVAWLRNALLRLTPDRLLARPVASLADWRVE